MGSLADTLTARQRQIAGLVAEGLTNKAIGKQLYLSEYTVKTTLAAVFRKTDVTSRAELASLVTAQARVRTGAEVVGMIRRTLVSLEASPEPRWGTEQWYRREGAVGALRSIVEQIAEVR